MGMGHQGAVGGRVPTPIMGCCHRVGACREINGGGSQPELEARAFEARALW